MTIKKFEMTSKRFRSGSPPTAGTAFRGRTLRGLEAFGWYTAEHTPRSMRSRLIDHRTLLRPRDH